MGLKEDIELAINRASAENGSDTPDFILAEYLIDCLTAFDKATNMRHKWQDPRPPPRIEIPIDATPKYGAPFK